MTLWFKPAAFGAVLLCLVAGTAVAEAPCGVRDGMAAALEGRFGEKIVGRGLAGPNALVELFVSASGSWTLLVTDPRGLACVLAAGEAWDGSAAAVPEAPPRQES